MQSCIFDQCETNGNRVAFIEAIETYAVECQTAGLSTCDWRNETDSSEFLQLMF